MRTIIAIFMMAATVAMGAPGTPRTATGSTSAYLAWPGTAGLNIRLTAVDATSDLAGSKLTWRFGVTNHLVAVASAAAATNIVMTPNLLASNDIVLLQDSLGNVTQKIVVSRSSTTNSRAYFDAALGTNLAVGDKIWDTHPTYYTTQERAASNATTLWIDTTNSLVATTGIVAIANGVPFKTTVSSFASAAKYSAPLYRPAISDVTAGDAVYARSNYFMTALTAAAYDATTIHVSITNGLEGFKAAALVLIEGEGGNLSVKTINTMALTNLSLTVAPGIAVPVGGRIWLLASATTAKMPTLAGAAALQLTASNGISSGVTAVVVPTTGQPWVMPLTADCTAGTARSVVLANATVQVYEPGTRLYTLTNSATVAEVASRSAGQAVVSSTASWTAGDPVLLVPASGGSALNTFRIAETRVLDTVTVTNGGVGFALAPGDGAWTSAAVAPVVGAASVHWFGPTVFLAPKGTPATLTLTGTSACTLNMIIDE